MIFYLKGAGESDAEGVAFENRVSGHEQLDAHIQGLADDFWLEVQFKLDDVERTPEQKLEILKNYRAVLRKAWHHMFAGENPPANPWAGPDRPHDRVTHDENSVTIHFNVLSTTPRPYLRSVIWRLANAFEWCMLPNRKVLVSNAGFTRETWNGISIYRNEDLLKKPTSADSHAQDPEPVASDHQAQTDAAE